jgi:ribosome-associated translation inhibitor RaiA
MNNASSDFPIEFHNEVTGEDLDLYAAAENHLRQLAKGHRDITGATVILTQPAHGQQTAYIYEATVTLWMRPENIAARATGEQLLGTLTDALRAAERQVRQHRDKLREQARVPVPEATILEDDGDEQT